jgi:ABC-type transport system involved in cytochrome c biogenesis permease subunit
MLTPDRLNPNAMLVVLGSVMYAVVGGPVVIGGGFTIALALFAIRHWEARHPGDSGPTSLFGASEPASAHLRLIVTPPAFRLMPAVCVAR